MKYTLLKYNGIVMKYGGSVAGIPRTSISSGETSTEFGIVSMQSFDVSLYDTSTSVSVPLSGFTNYDNMIGFLSYDLTNTSNLTVYNAYSQIDLSLNSINEVIFSRGGTNAGLNANIQCDILEFSPSTTVYKGDYYMDTATLIYDVSIGGIITDTSTFVFHHIKSNSTTNQGNDGDPEDRAVSSRFLNSSTIRLERRDSAKGSVWGHWFVVSHPDVSVHHGSILNQGGNNTVDVGFVVDTSTTFLLASHDSSEPEYNQEGGWRIWLSTDTNRHIRTYAYYGGESSPNAIYYQLIHHPNLFVQRYLATGNQSEFDASISSIDPSRTVAIPTLRSGYSTSSAFSTANFHHMFLRFTIQDEVNTKAYDTPGETIYTSWQIVQFPQVTNFSTTQYQTVYDAYSNKPSTSVATQQDTLVSTLVDAGIWDKMDLFYVFANNASDNSRINWVSPGTFDASEVGSGELTFTAYEGWTGDGVNYLSTGWDASVDSVNFTLNDNGHGVYARTFGGYGKMIGAINDFRTGIYYRGPTPSAIGTFGYSTNSQSAGITPILFDASDAGDTSTGMLIASRQSPSSHQFYFNGVQGDSEFDAATMPSDGDFVILAGNLGAPAEYAGQISMAFTSGGLSESDASIITKAFDDYLTSLYTAEYQTIYNSFSTKPSRVVADEQNTMVSTLVDAGIWDRIDAFWIFANDASDNALINWKEPATHTAIPNNSPTFTSYEGFTGNDLDMYIDLNWIPSVDASNYSQNSAAISFYSMTDASQSTETTVGGGDGTNNNFCSPYYTDGNTYWGINAGGYDAEQNYYASGAGFFTFKRDNATDTYVYRNGLAMNFQTEAVSGLPTVSQYALAYNNNGSATEHSSRKVSTVMFSDALSLNDSSIVSNAFETYMDSNGKGVIS